VLVHVFFSFGVFSHIVGIAVCTLHILHILICDIGAVSFRVCWDFTVACNHNTVTWFCFGVYIHFDEFLFSLCLLDTVTKKM
jgi:hypothetical protein